MFTYTSVNRIYNAVGAKLKSMPSMLHLLENCYEIMQQITTSMEGVYDPTSVLPKLLKSFLHSNLSG